MLDTISEQVHGGVGAGIHGDAATIDIDSQTLAINIERQVDADDEFDTGGVDLEYNKLVIILSPETIGVSNDYGTLSFSDFCVHTGVTLPELGRTSTVATVVFASEPSKTWYVRKVLNDQRASGYFKVLLTDTKAPLE